MDNKNEGRLKKNIPKQQKRISSLKNVITVRMKPISIRGFLSYFSILLLDLVFKLRLWDFDSVALWWVNAALSRSHDSPFPYLNSSHFFNIIILEFNAEHTVRCESSICLFSLDASNLMTSGKMNSDFKGF